MANAAGMRTYLRDVIEVADPLERREAIRLEGLGVIQDSAEVRKKISKLFVAPSENRAEQYPIQMQVHLEHPLISQTLAMLYPQSARND